MSDMHMCVEIENKSTVCKAYAEVSNIEQN